MSRSLSRLAPVALAGTAALALLTGADTAKPQTQWQARPAEAARVTRVEKSLPPYALPGGKPTKLTLQQWMELYKIPGLSVAVFDKGALVWSRSYGVKQSG